ncbi:CPS_HP_G0101530.mRNA.1.CDS.1 [Saccharomyces cerevisiae]|nr:CPS_HP_G0101530.mRNA.1.CDS.1 [Saccharomyces cerevisiae]CAI6947623.1 CPS_HP_G0101530.mRNA.1.CDS.1 [Saccharomyces cerevisiae]
MIVNNTHVLTLPLYTTTTCHTHPHLYTDFTYAHGCYSIYHLPYSHIPLHGPSLTESVPNALTSLCTALASAVYTLCHLPITPMIIHILISISHSAAPNIV